MRLIRQLRGETLEEIGASLNFRKSTLSSAERFPSEAGPRLRKALECHYGVSYAVLQKPISGSAIADSIISEAIKTKDL